MPNRPTNAKTPPTRGDVRVYGAAGAARVCPRRGPPGQDPEGPTGSCRFLLHEGLLNGVGPRATYQKRVNDSECRMEASYEEQGHPLT
jgi:hypothetical protein